ncbi:MAG: VWA domain-containing protein [Acidobacteriota bacterium]
MRLVVSLLTFSSLVLAQQAPAFKIEANYIKVPVSVFDSRGKILADLTRDDFRLFDQGEPRPIENFVLDTNPTNVILLLDASGSVQEEIEEIQDAALSFARSLKEEDRIAVISFSDEVILLQNWTNNLRRLKNSLDELESGYRTALYDALLATARERLDRVNGKRIIILLTDGIDNQSEASYAQVMQSLVESNISLYIISRTRFVQPKVEKSERVEFLNRVMKNVLNESKDFVDIYFREKETAMRYLAESTGGRVFFPHKLSELQKTYLQLAEELKRRYILTFRPPDKSSKSFREIQVFYTDPTAILHYRSNYHWVPPAGN